MAKYELIKKTDRDGIWYHITKDGEHINQTWTKDIDEANSMFSEIEQKILINPITEILKTFEIDEN